MATGSRPQGQAASPTDRGCKCLATLVISPLGRWVNIQKVFVWRLPVDRLNGSKGSLEAHRAAPVDGASVPVRQSLDL